MKAIIAINKLGYIDKEESLPWKCKEDLNHFKKMTMNCKLLVGRKTFETLPFKKTYEKLRKSRFPNSSTV